MVEMRQVWPGVMVELVVPENQRLHGRRARVLSVEEWGCHLVCAASGTGLFRALWEEMNLVEMGRALLSGVTGDVCARCGGSNVVRAGSCACCQDCGETTGCS